ncbi:MAG: M23 family metallopeptidase [Gammaproteobacteria bacterium]|nr:MAG: M23 family metallopeptidase [Gammaproteobacteria bacterium]
MKKHIRVALFSLITLIVAPTTFALEVTGEWQQGAVIIGQVPKGVSVEYNQRKLRLTQDGKFVIGLGRDAPATATIKTFSGGKSESRTFNVKARDYKIQRVEGVPQATVEPSKEQVERIAREAALVKKARTVDLPLNFFAQKFQWPLVGPISGVYGSQRIYNGVPGTAHVGLDIAKPVGAVVKSPAGGTVTLVHPDMFLSGGTLIIDHGHGLSSTFIHLSKILVKTGDKISQGQKIALVGQTGRASGPHLHWAMNWFEERVDPQLLVPPAIP